MQIGLENPKEVSDSCEIMQACMTSFCCFWSLTVKDGEQYTTNNLAAQRRQKNIKIQQALLNTYSMTQTSLGFKDPVGSVVPIKKESSIGIFPCLSPLISSLTMISSLDCKYGSSIEIPERIICADIELSISAKFNEAV